MLLLLVFILIVQTITSQNILQIKRVTNTSADIQCEECLQQNITDLELRILTKINGDSQYDSIPFKLNKDKYSTNVTGLAPGSNHTFQLIRHNLDGGSNILDKIEFVTPPNAPRYHTISVMSEHTILIQFIGFIPNLSSYLISVTNSSQQIVYLNEMDYSNYQEPSPQLRITGLKPGKKYTVFTVATIPGLNHGLSVSEPSIHSFITKPLPPTDLNVDEKSLSTHSLTIHWKHPKSSEYDYYYIECKANEKFLFKSINKTQNKTTFNSIDPGLTYQIKLTAIINDQAQLIESTPLLLNVTTPPLPIIDLKIKTTYESNVTLEWTPDEEHSHQDAYKVSHFDLQSKDDHVHYVNERFLHLSDLTPGHNYSISVTTLSQNMSSNVITVYQIIEDKTSKIWKILTTLIIIFLISLLTTAIYFYYDIKKNFKTDPSIEDNSIELPTIDVIVPSHSTNDYSTFGTIEPELSIDQDITINRDDLEIGELIGLGQFGSVYSGLLQLKTALLIRKENVAIKASNNLNHVTDMNQFLEEALRMKNFGHKNVLSLIGVCIDENGLPLVVLPFMANGDLLRYVRNEGNSPTVKQLLNFTIDVANGMEYLSSQRFIHRDLAARNCMIDEVLNVKVADFGLSRHLMESTDLYVSGNLMQKLPLKWMSIESIERRTFDTKSDVWSYGVLVWEVLTRGIIPYPEIENRNLLNYLKEGHRLPHPAYCPKPIYDTLMQCWDTNPQIRPEFHEISPRFEALIKMLEQNFKQEQVKLGDCNIYYNCSSELPSHIEMKKS